MSLIAHTREMKMSPASWAFTAHETSNELVIGPAHVHNTRLDSSHFLRAKVNILLVLNYLFFSVLFEVILPCKLATT